MWSSPSTKVTTGASTTSPRGAYVRIEIQPNAIPDDDGQDDLYAPEHPAVRALLLTNTPTPEPTLHTRLGTIQGLVHLSHESC